MIDNIFTEGIEKDPTRMFAGKVIYPALLDPGIHLLSLSSLEETVLNQFEEKRTRSHFCNRFRALIQELETFNVEIIIWIDGSFCSKKPHPSDIDVVLFLNEDHIQSLSVEKYDLLLSLLTNRDTIRARYNCDLYFDRLNDINRTQYWQNYFSSNQLSEAKGFIQIRVNAHEHLYS